MNGLGGCRLISAEVIAVVNGTDSVIQDNKGNGKYAKANL